MMRAIGRLRARLLGITPQAGDFLMDQAGNNLTDESGNLLTA